MKERIKKIRKDLEMTQIKFGEALGVKGNTITNYETGLRVPSDAVIKSICREFNVNEEWLKNGAGEPYKLKTDDYSEISVLIGETDEKARQAIIDYWHLSDNDKKLFWNFIDRFFKPD